MIRKSLKIISFFIIIVLSITGWIILGPATTFQETKKIVFLKEGAPAFENLENQIDTSSVIKYPRFFKYIALRLKIDKSLRNGRFEIKKNQNLWSIIRMLKNNRQAPVKLIITKVRTKEQLASFLANKMEASDSLFLAFLNNDQLLSNYQLNKNTVMAAIMPNTYELYWNSTPKETFEKLFRYYNSYWTPEKIKKASDHKLSPVAATIIASIVEEETAYNPEKPFIASVYINRYQKGMRLQADPTIKFALNDFALKRIYEKHLAVESAYNTYRNNGLPPGPICIPSATTLEAVLNAPETNFLYFVAKSDFSGKHEFSQTYEEHLIKAKAFQEAQDQQENIKKNGLKLEEQL